MSTTGRVCQLFLKEGGEEYLIEFIHASFHGDFHCCL